MISKVMGGRGIEGRGLLKLTNVKSKDCSFLSWQHSGVIFAFGEG